MSLPTFFSFLLRLSEVKYYWLKLKKGKKTVSLLCLMRSDIDPMESVINHVPTKSFTFGVGGRFECCTDNLTKFQSISG